MGLIANLAADRLHLPFSAVAFAGAVPMMPGVFIYQSIAGGQPGHPPCKNRKTGGSEWASIWNNMN